MRSRLHHQHWRRLVNPILSLALVGLVYVLIVGVLSFLRREDFSTQFVAEALIGTGLVVLIALVSGWAMHPVFMLAFLYLLTMRARLLADLGNLLAGRGQDKLASSLYRLALQVRPDQTATQIVRLNQAIHDLKQNRLNEAIEALERLLKERMSPKHEAAGRYNLAVAYQRQGNDARATVEYNKVVDLMPGSLYGMGAHKALERGRQQSGGREPKQRGDDQD
jgi:tetratricopeptide (TPR) repeat protein